MRKFKKHLRLLLLALAVMAILCVPAFASSGGKGNVGAVVESTWKDAAGQIKTVVNNVVFPALDMLLTIAFFGKSAMAYFDYKKHGQFEWTGPVILFACLILTLTAPTYIWTIIGI
jgi:hypothetical protein